MKIFKAEPSYWYLSSNEKTCLLDNFFLKRQSHRHSLHLNMFHEDFARLFRPTNRRSANLFEIQSSDKDLVEKILNNIQTRRSPRNLDERIRDLIEEIAHSLIDTGKAYYYVYAEGDQLAKHITPLSSTGLSYIFGTLIQWVPSYTAKNWDRDDEKHPREIRILEAAKVLQFSMPSSIKKILKRQNRILQSLDEHQFRSADFHIQSTHENPNPTNYFNFKAWSNVHDQAFYRATTKTGWNGRKYDSTNRSDFFDCHRLIRFRRNQLLLRDNILTQLGIQLSRIGRCYDQQFWARIVTTNSLPSVFELDELESKLKLEQAGFNEVIDCCFKR